MVYMSTQGAFCRSFASLKDCISKAAAKMRGEAGLMLFFHARNSTRAEKTKGPEVHDRRFRLYSIVPYALSILFSKYLMA